VNYGVRHQLVMDGSYALYIEFLDKEHGGGSDGDMTSADFHMRHFIVEFSATSYGIWDTPPGISVLDQVGDIVLNSREVVMFLVWNASASMPASLGPPPTPADLQAIQVGASRKNGTDESSRGKKRTRSSYTGGGDLDGAGAMGGPSGTVGSETGKRGRFYGDHSNRKQGGDGDEPSRKLFQQEPEELEDGPPVSTTLPPVGTIFELVPAEPAPDEDSGFWDNTDDTSAHNESTSGSESDQPVTNVASTQPECLRASLSRARYNLTSSAYPETSHGLSGSQSDQPATNVASTQPECLRASRSRALYNLTSSAASSYPESGHGLVAQISKLLTPHVALITLLGPTLGSEATAGPLRIIMKSFPGEDTCSPGKGPLAGLLPSQFPLPTELSAYKAFATAGAGSDHVNDSTLPVPHYFGAWKYMPLRMPSYPDASPTTPQFTVILVEDLSAPGLDGLTVLDYFYLVKQTRLDVTSAERDLMYDAAKSSLEWLHTKAHVSHRDLSESNVMVLRDPVRVVLIDFDQAAVGERVLEGCGALIPNSRRRYWDAIKGWGKMDRIVLREIFERVRVRGGGSDGVGDAGGKGEDGSSDECESSENE